MARAAAPAGRRGPRRQRTGAAARRGAARWRLPVAVASSGLLATFLIAAGALSLGDANHVMLPGPSGNGNAGGQLETREDDDDGTLCSARAAEELLAAMARDTGAAADWESARGTILRGTVRLSLASQRFRLGNSSESRRRLRHPAAMVLRGDATMWATWTRVGTHARVYGGGGGSPDGANYSEVDSVSTQLVEGAPTPPMLLTAGLWEVDLSRARRPARSGGDSGGGGGGFGADAATSAEDDLLLEAAAVGDRKMADRGGATSADGVPAMVVIAGGERSVSYIAAYAGLLLNKAQTARARAERLFVWTGALPHPLDAPGEHCVRNVSEEYLMGCHKTTRRQGWDPSCPSEARAGTPSVHYAKMPAALLALDTPGVSDVAVIDMDTAFSTAARGRHRPNDSTDGRQHLQESENASATETLVRAHLAGPPAYDAFYSACGAPGASVAFFMGHRTSQQRRWQPMGDAFHVRDTRVARDFLLAWLGLRCGLKDQPPLWHILLRMHSAAGTLLTDGVQYPVDRGALAARLENTPQFAQSTINCRRGPMTGAAYDGSERHLTVFDCSYSDLIGGNIPWSFMRTMVIPSSPSCVDALHNMPVAFFSHKQVAGGWIAGGNFGECKGREARSAEHARRAIANEGEPRARAHLRAWEAHGRCAMWHFGSIKDNSAGIAEFFDKRW